VIARRELGVEIDIVSDFPQALALRWQRRTTPAREPPAGIAAPGSAGDPRRVVPEADPQPDMRPDPVPFAVRSREPPKWTHHCREAPTLAARSPHATPPALARAHGAPRRARAWRARRWPRRHPWVSAAPAPSCVPRAAAAAGRHGFVRVGHPPSPFVVLRLPRPPVRDARPMRALSRRREPQPCEPQRRARQELHSSASSPP